MVIEFETIGKMVRNGTLVRTEATKMLDAQIRDAEANGLDHKALRRRYHNAGYVIDRRQSYGKYGYVVYDYAK